MNVLISFFSILICFRQEPEQFRELSNFEVFRNEVIQEKGIQPHRTLWQIGAGAARVHGVVHFLGKFDDGTYALIDWDGNKILRDRLKNAFGTAAE